MNQLCSLIDQIRLLRTSAGAVGCEPSNQLSDQLGAEAYLSPPIFKHFVSSNFFCNL